MPFLDARKQFNEHLKSLVEGAQDGKRKGLTAGELMDLFLEWVEKNRSKRSYSTRKTYCSRFGSFRVGTGQTKVADLPAGKIKGADLETWLGRMKEEGLGPQTRLHAETSVKHCWNWATKHPSPIPYLASTYRPFSGVERTHVPLKALTEDDLITEEEIAAVFAAAKLDLDRYHRYGPKKAREKNPYSGFVDMLKCYYHTGARTAELASCEVGDVLFRTQQVVLGKHKRSRTQRTPTVRNITLNAEALEIFERLCDGKEKTDKVFLNSDNRPWNRQGLPARFERVKEVAAMEKIGFLSLCALCLPQIRPKSADTFS